MAASRLSRILTSKWLITLTGTLIGAFLALFLNEQVAIRKLNQQKAIASENIMEEIKSNKEELEKAIDYHERVLAFLMFRFEYTNEEDLLIVPQDTMAAFQLMYPDVITVTDSTFISEGIYQYKGEADASMSYSNINMTTVAWETLRDKEVASTYPFKCLMELEKLDKLTQEVIQGNKELLMTFMTGAFSSDSQEEVEEDSMSQIIVPLRLLLQYEKLLLSFYEYALDEENILMDCM
ncbi:MAG: hypothetical protein AAGI23_17505 [Bacteroidota bacterium]